MFHITILFESIEITKVNIDINNGIRDACSTADITDCRRNFVGGLLLCEPKSRFPIASLILISRSFLENIDIDKRILKNINIDKILNQFNKDLA